MSAAEPRVSLYFVRQRLPLTAIIWFAAPYSTSETVELPVGLLLRVKEYPDRDADARFQAEPVERHAWQHFLLSAGTRRDKNFRGDYEFFPSAEQLLSHCEAAAVDAVDDSGVIRHYQALRGSLIGLAVGDALGLPFEGLSPRRLQKFKPLPLRHRFFFGRGMFSDDTEHACMVAQALLLSRADPKVFARSLAWRTRFWFLGLPAGIGLATLRACLRLMVGFSALRSGVYSAGNGPAMRSALIGVYSLGDPSLTDELVRVSTRLTHTDPKAEKGARIVAELAARNARGERHDYSDMTWLLTLAGDDEALGALLQDAIDSAAAGESATQFSAKKGWARGVSGYMYHTLPVVVQIALRLPADYEQAISEAVACGGDTDTVAAIVGGVVGAGAGVETIPDAWLSQCRDWPRSVRLLERCAAALAIQANDGDEVAVPRIGLIRVWIRNAFFMVWVLMHGFRRLLPPY